MAGANAVQRSSIRGQGEIRVDSPKGSPIELNTIDIEGKIYKPSVFYILGRQDISYKGIEFQQNFTYRILRDAFKRPF